MKPTCAFCETSSVDEELGPFYHLSDYHFHSNCLVFSSDIRQNPDKSVGINGFDEETIELTLRRGRIRMCTWCWRTGATVKCSGDGSKYCGAVYHLPCALESKTTTHECFDNYQSYCSEHIPHLCIFDYEPIYGIVTKTDCCGKVYSHDNCMAKYVRVAKSLTKCPLCYDVENFKSYLKNNYTVKISKKNPAYARWSDSGYAMECSAETCLCPEIEGRQYHDDATNSPFELLDCSYCGSDSIHRFCKEIGTDDDWICNTCTPESKVPKEKKTSVFTSLNLMGRLRKWVSIKLLVCISPQND